MVARRSTTSPRRCRTGSARRHRSRSAPTAARPRSEPGTGSGGAPAVHLQPRGTGHGSSLPIGARSPHRGPSLRSSAALLHGITSGAAVIRVHAPITTRLGNGLGAQRTRARGRQRGTVRRRRAYLARGAAHSLRPKAGPTARAVDGDTRLPALMDGDPHEFVPSERIGLERSLPCAPSVPFPSGAASRRLEIQQPLNWWATMEQHGGDPR